MEKIMARHFSLSPELKALYDERQVMLCKKDIIYNLNYFAQAVGLNSPVLFKVYVGWLRTFLLHVGVNIPDVIKNFSCMESILIEEFPADFHPLISQFMTVGYDMLKAEYTAEPSFIEPGNPLYQEANAFLNLILDGNRSEASKLVLKLAQDKNSIKDIYIHILQPIQREIGRLWQTNVISVAQEHYCTSITQLVISQLYPHIFGSEPKYKTLVATCVSGELHEIGLRMLSDIFELEGWDTWYLGANMPHGDIVKTLIEKKADVLAISATMTYHLDKVSDLIAEIRKQGLKIPIMVGGYPFNMDQELWQRVGADAFANDAVAALQTADGLLN